MIKTYFLKRVLDWIAKIDWTQFLQIIGIVKEASRLYPMGTLSGSDPKIKRQINLNRAEFASDRIAKLIGREEAGGNVIAFLREVALWYERRTP